MINGIVEILSMPKDPLKKEKKIGMMCIGNCGEQSMLIIMERKFSKVKVLKQ